MVGRRSAGGLIDPHPFVPGQTKTSVGRSAAPTPDSAATTATRSGAVTCAEPARAAYAVPCSSVHSSARRVTAVVASVAAAVVTIIWIPFSQVVFRVHQRIAGLPVTGL
ncbi:hypothetical protein BN11_10048 [Nostocoides australiense Ben110]|uniref:Uncharacterized protein n=1 Tax=Nostocoides australiense Ben110 TaxID=1193182 RepID=W6JT63_9MICO|nr:hypothetical protein BN11_10048 [Tetrasphaera australiensis Ben110]